MKKDIGLYEKKVILDKEFPIEVYFNEKENLMKREKVFPSHWHEHIEVHEVMSGEMEIMLEHETFFGKEGELAVANGNVLHAGYCSSNLKSVVIIFAMEDLAKEVADENLIFCKMISGDPVIREIIPAIYREFKEAKMGYRLICKGEVLRLVAHLARNYVEEVLSDKEQSKRLKQLERFNTVRQYIRLHYTEPICNRELAELIHLSEDRFNHLFKECMGVSPLQYVNEIRLQKAMQLLKVGEYSTSEVAEMVGFTDYNHFGRLFRKSFGFTPSQVSRNS